MAMRYPTNAKGQEVKGAKWTDTALKALLKEPVKGQKLSDGEGLVGTVRVSTKGEGAISWEWAYKWEGAVRWYYCGTYPAKTLAAIRDERDAAKKKKEAGVNPATAKAVERAEAQAQAEAALAAAATAKEADKTLRALAEDYLSRIKRKDGNKLLRSLLEKNVLTFRVGDEAGKPVPMGDRPLRTIRDSHIHSALKGVLARRAGSVKRPGYRTVDMTLDELRTMFEWGLARPAYKVVMPHGNPAHKKLLPAKEVLPRGAKGKVRRKRVLCPAELAELPKLFAFMRQRREVSVDGRCRYPLNPYIEVSVWLALSTMARINTLCLAEWAHVDLKKRTWFIPAANLKETEAQKAEPFDVTIPLSDFACRWFARLREVTGGGRWCFPQLGRLSKPRVGPGSQRVTPSDMSRLVSDRQAMFSERSDDSKRKEAMTDELVTGEGAYGNWTHHDLRRTGATMMRAMRVERAVIAACLAHSTEDDDASGNEVEKEFAALDHYVHHEYATEMREAFDLLGAKLGELTAPRLVKKAA